MHKDSKRIVIKKIRIILVRFFLLLFLLFVGIVILFSFPFTQNFVAQRTTQWLHDKFDVSIEIGRIQLKWNSEVSIRSVLIRDFKNDTLIAAENIETSISSFGKLLQGQLYFGDISADKLKLFITTYADTNRNNLSIFIDKFHTDTPSGNTPFVLQSQKIDVRNSRIRITDKHKADPTLFELDRIALKSQYLRIKDFDVQAKLLSGSMRMNRKLNISHLEADYRITDTLMSVLKAKIQTPYSQASADLVLHYPKGGLEDFLNQVRIEGDVVAPNVSTNDLNAFYNGFSPNKTLAINSTIDGTINNLILKNVRLNHQNTHIEGEYHFQHLLSDKNLVIFANIKKTSSVYSDLATLMPVELGQNIPEKLSVLDVFSVKGTLSYTTENLSTDLQIDTREGSLFLISRFQQLNQPKQTHYQGNLTVNHIHLGKLLNVPSLGHLSGLFAFSGKGFDKMIAENTLTGRISHLKFNHYDYQNFEIQAGMHQQKINLELEGNDLNLVFQVEATGVLDKLSEIQAQAIVKKAQLHNLQLIKQDSLATFQGTATIHWEQKDPHRWVLNSDFSKVNYKNSIGDFFFKDFSAQYISEENNYQKIQLYSPDIISGVVEGNFKWSEWDKILQNSLGGVFSSYKPIKITENQKITYNLKIYNKIVEMFFPNVRMEKNTFLRGEIIPDDRKLQLYLDSPEIHIGPYELHQVNVILDTKNPDLLNLTKIASLKTPYYPLKNINIIGAIQRDTLSFRTQMKGGKSLEDAFELDLFTTLNKHQEFVFGTRSSKLLFKSNLWQLTPSKNDNHHIVFSPSKGIRFENIELRKSHQSIGFSANFKNNSDKDIFLNFHQVPLYEITPEIDSFLWEGTLDGNLSFQERNQTYIPKSNLKINGLKLNGDLIGDAQLQLTGNESLTDFQINASVSENQVHKLQLTGGFSFDRGQTLLNLKTTFDGFSLHPINSLIRDILSGIQGYAHGAILLGGTLQQMEMQGDITLKNAELSIPFLNLNTQFPEDIHISVTRNAFTFHPTQLLETTFQTQAEFKGVIRHKNLQNWIFDLSVDSQNKRFLALNTTYKPKDLFYGTGFIRGKASISGTIDDLRISVEAQTTQGTKFNIPLENTSDTQDDSFITFVEKNEKNDRSGTSHLNKGLSVYLDLNIDPTSEVKVILDSESDNYLLAKGEGGVLIDLNTNGKFNMWGDYVIYSGTYNYNYKGVLSRKFTLTPGGSIVWNGNPTAARLQNVEAIFNLYANPSVLLESSTNRRNIPTQVIIKLEGDLLHPNPSFDIRFPDSNPILTSEINFRLNDKDKKQLQSLSLLAQGTFVKEQSFDNNFSNSIYETATGLFNQLLSSNDDKLSLGLSYEAENSSTENIDKQNRLGVTFNTSLNDRFLINGKIGVPLGGDARTSIGGDFELQYLVNKEGTLRLKAFNRESDWQQYASDRIGYTQGIGIYYKVDFSNLKELFEKIVHQNRNNETN